MRLTRGLLVLAIVAALWGAPSTVSAAANELSSPEVSPSSGSVTTLFTFRVRYEGAFPAASVGVSVAGLTVPMLLQSGSLTAGWWAATSLLPSGAWSTSFRATAAQGPAATLAGPVVIVAGLATPSPTSSGVAPPSSGTTPESAPADDLDGPTVPPAAPAPSPEAAAATATPLATSPPAAPGPDPAPAGSGGSDAPSEGGSAGTPAPGGGGGSEGDRDAPAGQGAPAASTRASPAPGGDPAVVRPASDTDTASGEGARTEEMVSDVVFVGLAGVASVAIIGTLLLVAGRRRQPARATASPAPPVADDALARRRMRGGRVGPGEDPIVAALGVDDEMAARRAIRRATRHLRGGDELLAKRPKRR
jgi:hypothetical protein